VPADLVQDDNPALARVARRTTPAATLAALGIVYGDLGTSPLYTLQAVVGATGGHFSSEAALGTLSLIFWALTITISVKYCLFVMRADNHGEGGILALMSMTGANWSEGGRVLIVMGLFGAALLYGDGIITPAISVLSALEGLNARPMCSSRMSSLWRSRSCSPCSPSKAAAPGRSPRRPVR
jgi:KUP system potassium uptake protein